MSKKESVSTRWLGNMAFETEVSGHKLIVDADPAAGGEDRGPRPKLLMLSSLGGCTAMDVVAILKKMRVEIESLNVVVEGDLTEDYPKHFSKMHIIYEFTGKDLPVDKLQKAIDLSSEKYCGCKCCLPEAMLITSALLFKETI